ncbi:MAG: sulfite:cytochrome C oxidoreductase subunit B [Achromobacter sp.]
MTRPARRHPHGHLVRLAIALASMSACASAAALDIQLPPETATLHPGTGAGAQSAALCLMCHSVDYLSSQPPMPLGFWDAEVKKMVGTYGAPIPAEQVPLIVQYLNEAYPPPQPAGSPKP